MSASKGILICLFTEHREISFRSPFFFFFFSFNLQCVPGDIILSHLRIIHPCFSQESKEAFVILTTKANI